MNPEVNLKNSNIQGFFIGLRTEETGKITMVGGGIRDAYIGALASDNGWIVLENVDINVKRIGLVSLGPSVIEMRSGAITVKEGGIGVISTKEGTVLLDGTVINVAEEPKTTEVGTSETNIGLLSLGGTISFKNGKLRAPNTVALLVSDSFKNNISVASNRVSGASNGVEAESEDGEDTQQDSEADSDSFIGEVISIETRDGAVLNNISSTYFEALFPIENFLGSGAD
ncbi:hypothetical protein, partial [Bartonella sp. AC66GZZY]|uniref:hypothetical protein n=1 Tax=Bartonella sp. AC66GZZY TaxID=3243458 RepID=UPI0035CF2597